MSKSPFHCSCVSTLVKQLTLSITSQIIAIVYHFYRTFINLLSDSSEDEDILESEVTAPVETLWEGYVCMFLENLNNNNISNYMYLGKTSILL